MLMEKKNANLRKNSFNIQETKQIALNQKILIAINLKTSLLAFVTDYPNYLHLGFINVAHEDLFGNAKVEIIETAIAE